MACVVVLLVGRAPFALASSPTQPSPPLHHHAAISHADHLAGDGQGEAVADHCPNGCDHGAGHCSCQPVTMPLPSIACLVGVARVAVVTAPAIPLPAVAPLPPERPPRHS